MNNIMIDKSKMLLLLGLPGWIAWLLIHTVKPLFATKLVVLGPKSSGKTAWLNYLQNKPSSSEKTGGTFQKEEYDTFEFTKSDGTTITIRKGYDISGEKENARMYWKDELQSTNAAVMYFFSLKEYVENPEYKEFVKEGLTYISKYFKKPNKNNFYLILTYKDQVKDYKKEVTKVFRELLNEKGLEPIMKDYSFATIDTTNTEDLKTLKDGLKL